MSAIGKTLGDAIAVARLSSGQGTSKGESNNPSPRLNLPQVNKRLTKAAP